MQSVFFSISGFFICASLIFYSGKYLSKYGDLLSEHLGLGKVWIGMVLMASVTSLPELTVGISSVTIVKSADLAVGDVLGSCVFNLLILSLLDLLIKQKSLLSTISGSHILAASMSIILVCFAGAGLFLPADFILTQWIGLTSILFIIVYFIAMRVIYVNEKKIFSQQAPSASSTNKASIISLKRVIGLYFFHAMIVLGAAVCLPYFAEILAVKTGLGESFVGTLFLAASTSLPEIAVSIAAVRIGLIDMAVGNLLGSNIFNILILSIDDIFYREGHLLKDAGEGHLVSVFSIVIMTSIVIAGLNYHNENKKRFLMAIDSFLILIIYILNLLLLYHLNNP